MERLSNKFLEELAEDYRSHFGLPYKINYPLEASVIKNLIKSFGEDVTREAWNYLIRTDDDWLKNFKTIPDLSKYINRICSMMRGNNGPGESLESILKKAELAEKKQRERFAEMLKNEVKND